MTKRRMFIGGVTAAAALTLAACGNSGGAGGEGDAFPSKDVNMVVTYAAGGPTDVAGRAIAKFMEKDLDTTFVVENKDGASGAVGTADVVRSKADGYTIAMTTESAVARVPAVEDVGYTYEDVTPIGVATYGPGLVLVSADSPYKTIDELVAAAKKDPGGIKFGTAGASSPQHLELMRLKQDYDVDIEAVPFKGEAPAVTAVLGNNVQGCFCSNAQTTMAQVDAGKFKVLAVGTEERLPSMEDVPTLKESGFPELIHGNSYFVLVAPKDTPADAITALEGSLEKALKDEATVTTIGDVRILPEFMGSEELKTMMTDEQETLIPSLKELLG
jgi:tripartite-type tricarboxylate transporter receptor subunit TctC